MKASRSLLNVLSRSRATRIPIRYSSRAPFPAIRFQPLSYSAIAQKPQPRELSESALGPRAENEKLPLSTGPPSYELTFTCKPCKTRSAHRITKQGYHNGTVLITCPGCKAKHVIADHLKIFSDSSTTIEDIMRDKGELVKKGTLGEDGDLEFWEDGTTTPRETPMEPLSKS